MVLSIKIIYEECVADDHTDDDKEEDSDEEPCLGKESVDNGKEKGEKDSYQIVEEVVKAGQLEKLKVKQCKVYLRKHMLRLTGNKDTLIQRIRQHLDVIDGGGEPKYPVSSFVVDCTGDVCAGDVVLFEQNVYEMFSMASRSASDPPCGTRLVAGRVVNESYGAHKHQHTFTIEVLWSTGEKPLPPLHQLLIKGRNLHRFKTTRRKWEDEAERQKVLSEKHARGDAARLNRKARRKERRKMLRQLKREGKKENISMNTVEEQPPEKKPNNLKERNHHQCKHHNPPEKGRNISVQRASRDGSIRNPSRAYHRGSDANHNSIRRAPTYCGSNHRSSGKVVCRYFGRGRCYYGDRCWWLHEDASIKVSLANTPPQESYN